MPLSLPALLTTAEVAELFQVNTETVTRWVREGTIAALRIPGMGGYRFRSDDVAALIESGTVVPIPTPAAPPPSPTPHDEDV